MKKLILKIVLGVVAAIIVLLVSLICWFKFVLLPTPDYTDLDDYHPFTSIEAKREYLEFYDKQEQRWPVPFVTKTIETSYGDTYVWISGDKDSTPLVLLPGGGKSSLMWIPNVEGLVEHYRVIAVDNIVDFGKSRQSRPIQTSDELLDWLDELLGKLGIQGKVNVMGLSYGGWVTVMFALKHPERVNKAVVIAPAATVYPLNEDFLVNSIKALVFPSTLKDWVLTMCKDAAKSSDQFVQENLGVLIEESILGFRSFKYKNSLAPTVLTDGELRSIKPPTMFVIGENETLYPAEKAAKRLNTAAPNLQTAIIKGAGHDVTLVQAEKLKEKVFAFIGL